MIENVTIVGMGALGILYGDLMERTLGPGSPPSGSRGRFSTTSGASSC